MTLRYCVNEESCFSVIRSAGSLMTNVLNKLFNEGSTHRIYVIEVGSKATVLSSYTPKAA